MTRHAFRILLAGGLVARGPAFGLPRHPKRSRLRQVLRHALEPPVLLDPRAWEGLQYLESVSGPGAILELVEAFGRDAPRRLERMQAALARGDRAALERLAHDLKSNAATLGILALSERAARLERGAGEAEAADLAGLLEACRAMLPAAIRLLRERVSPG